MTREDQAVELDETDTGVSDALVGLGREADLVLGPERRELGALLAERVDDLVYVRIVRVATSDAA
jgi:hypothetical protein